ncbi:uncharacterized protein [Ranitomeya imitator]|uniref:uncharacterized protein n=1 Tax=Ranitomeya imitator TaxID=111125 RepID=UPI0037E8BB6F
MYLIEVLRQLNNTNNYHALPSDPTWVFKGKLDHLIREATREGILNKREAEFLVTHHPVVPTFYILPKVHKSLDRPPGRPIVSGIGGIMERPCIYLDHFLQPLALSLDSYIRDSAHLMMHLEDLTVREGTLLVGLDVESLYTSIAHDLGIRAVSFHLNKQHGNDFLDIKLTIEENRVSSCLYRKLTATNNLLHYSSFHPVHLKKGIPKGRQILCTC